jgi:5S rRNA maturation endonuclease (ribonuclease M5)
MQLGIKEGLKYRDISWLMPSIDVLSALERLGVEGISLLPSGEYQALCPDHSHFVGRESSHPNWIVCPETGCTYCRTEGRSSNLVWTISRMFGDCHPKKAVEFLTNGEYNEDSLRLAGIKRTIKGFGRVKGKEEKEVIGLDEVVNDLKNRHTTQKMYDFFMHPPGKKATNINCKTVDHYRVFYRTYGYYTNRVFIPCFIKEELKGFCAIDILGKDKWLRTHTLKTEDDYRKILYPLHFKSGEYLFGYDDCERNADIILTEGAREVMKLWQEGFRNSLSIFGGNVTDGHIRLLSKLSPKTIYLMFDGDSAGYEFNKRIKKRLERIFNVKVCIVPLGKDPKNLDKEEICKIIKKAK